MLLHSFLAYICIWTLFGHCTGASSGQSCSSLTIGNKTSENSFNLTCTDSTGIKLSNHRDVIISWFFTNGTEEYLIPSVVRSGWGNLTVHTDQAQNDTLIFRLSGTSYRAELEGNYSCGCSSPERTARSGRGSKTVLVGPLPDVNKPNVFAGEIGKPFTLSSQLVFRANSHLLQTEWFRGSCYEESPCSRHNGLSNQLDGTDLRIDNVSQSDGPQWYTQRIPKPSSKKTHGPLLFDFDEVKYGKAFFIPFAPPVISVSSPSLEKHGVIRVLLYNKQLFPSNHRFLKFTLSSYPPVFTTNDTTVDADQSFYSEEFRPNSLIVSLTPPSPSGGTFPPTIAVTWLAVLNIEQKTLNKVQLTQNISKLQKSIHKTTNRTVFFKIFEINDAQLNVNLEELQDGLIRATVNLAKPVPAEFPYSIHFVIVNPTGEESIATENGSTGTVSQSFILDGKGRLDREEKTFIRTTLYFQIGGQLVKGPQDTRKIDQPTSNTIIIAVSASCGAFIIVVILVAICTVVVAVKKRRKQPRPTLTYTPRPLGGSVCTGRASNMSDVLSNPGSVDFYNPDDGLVGIHGPESNSVNGMSARPCPIHCSCSHVELVQVEPQRQPHHHHQQHCHNHAPPLGVEHSAVPSRRRHHSHRTPSIQIASRERSSGESRMVQRQRSYSASQIDESYSQRRLRRHLQPMEGSESDNLPSVQDEGNEEDQGPNTEHPGFVYPVAYALVMRNNRRLSEERPPSTLTTSSIRSCTSTRPLISGNNSSSNNRGEPQNP